MYVFVENTALSLEANYDFLRVYDSPSPGSTVETAVVGFTGSTTLATTGYFLSAFGRCLTFRFTTDSSGTSTGGSIFVSGYPYQVTLLYGFCVCTEPALSNVCPLLCSHYSPLST